MDNPLSFIAVNIPIDVFNPKVWEFEPKFPLQWAAHSSNPDILEAVLNAGAYTKAETSYTPRAISYVLDSPDDTIEESDSKCIKMMLEHGAGVKKQFNGESCIRDAAMLRPYRVDAEKCREVFDEKLAQESIKIYKMLVAACGERSEDEIYDELFSAVWGNNYPLVKYILDSNKGLNINGTTEASDGATALFYIDFDYSDKETLKIAGLLLERGADRTKLKLMKREKHMNRLCGMTGMNTVNTGMNCTNF